MITDKDQEDTEEKWHSIALKSEPSDNGYKKPSRSLSKLYRGILEIKTIMEIFIVLAVYIHIELIINLKKTKDYAVTMTTAT